MRVLAYVLLGVFGGIGFMSFFQGPGKPASLLSPVSYAMPASAPDLEMEESPPWTGEDLLEMARIYDQQADELQSEAVKLEQRAIGLAKKPHMDPKGFSRTGFMHIAASRWKAARELRELAAMHRSEGKRLLAMENGEDHQEKIQEEKDDQS